MTKLFTVENKMEPILLILIKNPLAIANKGIESRLQKIELDECL